MNTIGSTIKKLRSAKGITQEELAEAVNVSYQAVSKWENGGSPDLEMLPILANYFGVSIDELMGFKLCGCYGNYPCKQIWHYCELLQRQKSSRLPRTSKL